MKTNEPVQPTPGAMRAAKKIALSEKIRQLALGSILRQTFADDIAQTISRETGDAELLDILGTALVWEMDYRLRNNLGNLGPDWVERGLAAIRKARGEQS